MEIEKKHSRNIILNRSEVNKQNVDYSFQKFENRNEIDEKEQIKKFMIDQKYHS